MRIPGAAMSYISIASPRCDPFRGGPSPKKDKKKSRSFTRALSSPIRRMGKQLSKRSSRKNPGKEKLDGNSAHSQTRDVEQGWIAPATTFETEDTLSPRSFDCLTTNDSCSSLLLQSGGNDEDMILNRSIRGPSQQFHPNQSWDLEAAVNESAETSLIFRKEDDVEDNTHDIECNEIIPENSEKQNAAPQFVETSDQNHLEDDKEDKEEESEQEDPSIQDFVFREQSSIIVDDAMDSNHEDTIDPMISLLSIIDTTMIIGEEDEIDSLVPAADISFFLDEGEGYEFHCVGRLSTHHNQELPVEINVDSVSLDDRSKNSYSEENNREVYIEDDDDVSSACSYNSYLQAIESITASANNTIERSSTKSIEKMEIETPSYPLPEVGSEEEPEIEEDEESYSVSFNPSRELLLQAMEGASAKAKIDIERATALALGKIRAASYASSKRESFNKTNTTAKYAPNRVLGFIFFLLLLFNMNGNSFNFFMGIRSISYSLGIDDFQIRARNDVMVKPYTDLSIWGEKQMVVRPNETQAAVKNEQVYNIGCASKVGCLALGNI